MIGICERKVPGESLPRRGIISVTSHLEKPKSTSFLNNVVNENGYSKKISSLTYENHIFDWLYKRQQTSERSAYATHFNKSSEVLRYAELDQDITHYCITSEEIQSVVLRDRQTGNQELIIIDSSSEDRVFSLGSEETVTALFKSSDKIYPYILLDSGELWQCTDKKELTVVNEDLHLEAAKTGGIRKGLSKIILPKFPENVKIIDANWQNHVLILKVKYEKDGQIFYRFNLIES
jgi:hypothetical protein